MPFRLPRVDSTQANHARGRATHAEQHDGEVGLERRLRADRMGGTYRGHSRLTPAPYPSAPALDDDADELSAELSAAAHDSLVDQFVASYQAGEWVGYPAEGSTPTPHPWALPPAARSSTTTNDNEDDKRSHPWIVLLTDACDSEDDDAMDTTRTAHTHGTGTTTVHPWPPNSQVNA